MSPQVGQNSHTEQDCLQFSLMDECAVCVCGRSYCLVDCCQLAVVPWWHVNFLLHATLAYTPSPANAITLTGAADREWSYKGTPLGRALPLALGHTPHCYVAVVVTVAVMVVVFN